MRRLIKGKLIKKFRELRKITQKASGNRTHLDDVGIRQYELDIRTPKEDILENISTALHVNKEYLNEPDYPYSLKKDYVPFEESNLKRFNNSMSVKVPPEIK